MIPGKLKNFEKALERRNDTNNLIINWAILLLGGIIAITITPKSENIKDDNWGLLFISPILVFLCASLYFASIYKQALTFQTATSRYNFPILNDVLYVQVLFFKYGLIPLLLFSLWYLIWRLLKIISRQRRLSRALKCGVSPKENITLPCTIGILLLELKMMQLNMSFQNIKIRIFRMTSI